MASNPIKIGLLIIGDEILSGKRQDRHFPKAIEIVGARGLSLSWSMYLPDDPQTITEVLSSTMARDDVVFSFGGIGATPDDHTRQCAARAAGVEVRKPIRGVSKWGYFRPGRALFPTPTIEYPASASAGTISFRGFRPWPGP
jgi:molybdopterin-biosynthesis enzyme MoeA-like protein